MATIEALLNRRTDLSTFVVHLTRDSESGVSARDNLLSILEEGTIQGKTAQGPARHLEVSLVNTGFTQKVVCLTETPLEHLWMMIEDIDGREIKFQPYGLATTKTSARYAGANPVWYSDITKGRDWPLKQLGELVTQAVERSTIAGVLDVDRLTDEPIMKIAPYFETMGPTSQPGRRKEFWWEREWRKIGDFPLEHPKRWVAILAPETEHSSLRAEILTRNIQAEWADRPLLDPSWGLERMIASLARVDDKYLGPFTSNA